MKPQNKKRQRSLGNSLLYLGYVSCLLFVIVPMLSFLNPSYFAEMSKKDWLFLFSALKVSAQCSLISTAIVFVTGIPAGYCMARKNFVGKNLLDLLFQIPMVLPPAVMGLLLLMTFGSKGFLGKYFSVLGFQLTFSPTAVVLTLIFVSLPVFVSGVSEGFRGVSEELEITAQLLGDRPSAVFWRVSFPLAKGSIGTALLLSWARGIAEFGATMMFAGNITGRTQTVPLAIYTAMEGNLSLAMLLSLTMLVLSFVILIAVKKIEKGGASEQCSK